MMTPEGFEKHVKKHLRKTGFAVLRTDYKNNMPDFLIASHGFVGFVEVKRYLTCKTLGDIIVRWQSNQPKQVHKIKELLDAGVKVFLYYFDENKKNKINHVSLNGLL